jgi:ribosome-associated translation inhibitor RaiA
VQLDIRFRGVEPSEALEARIRERAEQLDRQQAGLIHCRVVVEQRHHHHHQGALFHVRIRLTWRGGGVVVDREPHEDHSHEDAYVAVRDAFDALRRRLEDEQKRARGLVKSHAPRPSGAIVQLAPEGGVVETPAGEAIPFARDRLRHGRFEDLAVGELVRIDLVDGEIRELVPLGRQ